MPAILAPSPRRPLQHSILLPDPPRPDLVRPPPRLLSPIRLHDAANSKSPTPCSSSHKRRVPPRLLARPSRRRRHAQRIDCPLDAYLRSPIFDQLPWISALEVPCPANCDIADLSGLPLAEVPLPFQDAMPASGPVRRRKTSLRSNPLGSARDASSTEPLPRPHSPVHRVTDPCPRTPPPRVPFDPSRVTFHHLMPVFPHGVSPSSPV